MPALAVPEQIQPDTGLKDGDALAASDPVMQTVECNSASAGQDQTEVQPSQSMHAGSSAGEAALALEASEHPQDENPAASSSTAKPESNQVQAEPQVNGQHPAALALEGSGNPQDQIAADSSSTVKPESSQAHAGKAAQALEASEHPKDQTPADSSSTPKPESSHAQAEAKVNGQHSAAQTLEGSGHLQDMSPEDSSISPQPESSQAQADSQVNGQHSAALALEASEHPQDETPADSSSSPTPESSQAQAGAQVNAQHSAAMALEASEHPQDETPADSSSSPTPESSQAQAGPQVNGQHSAADEGTENGIVSPQDSGLQSSQEAEVDAIEELKRPSEAEQSSSDSTAGQADRADPAEVDSEKLNRHDVAPSTQAADEVRESGKSGDDASQSAAELQVAKAQAGNQTSNANASPVNGMHNLQPAGHAAAACTEFVLVSQPGKSTIDEPDNTQAAEQPEPPQQPAHADSIPGGAAEAAPMNGRPGQVNEIEEVSDDQSSDDEFYPDLPSMAPEVFSDDEDGEDAEDADDYETAFTFPQGMTELVLRGGLHPVRIPLPLHTVFQCSVQDNLEDKQPQQEEKANASIPAAVHPLKPSKVDNVQATTPDGDRDGHTGHEAPSRADSMPKAIDSPRGPPVLARCALRPGVAGDEQCDKAPDAFAIREGQRYLKVTCTEGCTITYHFTCWRRFERVYRVEHPEFSWKSKEGVQCFTDGCTGQVKLAQELEEEAGIDTHRRELLRLPDQAKKPERPPQPPQEQPEQRRGRKKGPAQRLPEPEPEPVVQQERAAERPAAIPANTNIDDKQEPLPKPDRVPALDSLLIPRQDDDDEDLERLAAGLKGKKEKKKREKKKEKEFIHISGPEEPKPPTVFDEYEHERWATPRLDPAAFPKMAWAEDVPDLAVGDDPLWDLLVSMKSGTSAEHLLIWHIDTQSLARRGISASDELHRLLSLHGRIASLELYLRLSAAAVSFTRTQDAQKALYDVEGHQLERKKLRGCFLREFPGDQDALAQKLKEIQQAQASAAPPTSATQQTDPAAELQALMNRESQNLPTDTHSVSGDLVAASQISLTAQEGAPAQPVMLSRAGSRSSSTRSPERVGRVDMQSLQIGDYLGLERKAVPVVPKAVPIAPRAAPAVPSQPVRAPVLLPRPQANLSVAAPEFRPGPAQDLPNVAAPEFRPKAARDLPNVAAPEFRPKAAQDLPSVAAPEFRPKAAQDIPKAAAPEVRPGAARNLPNVAAPAFRPAAARDLPSAPPSDLCPGVVLQGAVVQGANLERLMQLESKTSQTSLSSLDGTATSWPGQPSHLDAGRAMSVRSDASSLQRVDSAAGAPPPPPLRSSPQKLPGLEKLTAVQVVGCTRETLATFRQFQSDGGFAIPTTDLGTFNMLVEADCTGLLLYENESQMLHGLWKSTQFSDSGPEKVLEFEALADMAPLQGRLVLNVLQTHHTGELLVPQTARGTRMEALLPLLRPEGSPAPTPSSAPGKLSLNPNSKPFSPFATSGVSTPSTATAAAASTHISTIATITEAAQRISPRSQAVQKSLPSQSILKQTNSGTVLSRQAGEASKASTDGTAGSSTATGRSTESEVQRQLGITVHAEGFRASVTKYAEDLAKPPPGESAGSKAEPQTSGDTHRPLREVRSPRLYKRPAPEVSPAATPGGPSPAQSSGQASPEKAAGSTVSTDALPSPVSALSSNVRVPVQVPQPAAQQPGAEQQASSTPQAASPGEVQSRAQPSVTSVSGSRASVQQHVPGALPGPAKQPASTAAPTVPAPAVPPRRVPLPKLPRVPLPKLGGSSLAPPRPGSSGGDQLSSVLNFLMPKEAPKAAAAPSQRPQPENPQPSRPQPDSHKSPKAASDESSKSAAAQPQLPAAAVAEASGPDKDLPAPLPKPSRPQPDTHKTSKEASAESDKSAAAQPQLPAADVVEAPSPDKDLPSPLPKPSRPQPASKSEEGSNQLSVGASDGASGSTAKSGSPQVLSMQELVAAQLKAKGKATRAGRSTSPSGSQVSRESMSPARSSADQPSSSTGSITQGPATDAQAAKGKKKRDKYEPPAARAAAQPKPAPRPAPLGPWAAGPPAALVISESPQAHTGSDSSPVPPVTPAAIATAPQVSQPQSFRAAGPPTAQRSTAESQGSQPTQVPVPAAAAAKTASGGSAAPRTRPMPEYRPPAISTPSEALPWAFGRPRPGIEEANQSGTTASTRPASNSRVPVHTPGARAAAAPEPAAQVPGATALNLATAAAHPNSPSPQQSSRVCPLCKKEKAGHMVMGCQHLGPCHTCVPTPDRLDLYPVCLQCGTRVPALLKVYL